MGEAQIDGTLIKHLRRRMGMTQRQLAEHLNVDQGTVSRWERNRESPRPARRAELNALLQRDESRRAMLRCLAFVRQDYLPSTLIDRRLRLLEFSASAKRHVQGLGLDPGTLVGADLERYARRLGKPELHQILESHLRKSGLMTGDALLLRFVRNVGGEGHATVYEPIFEDGELQGILNYITARFRLPTTSADAFELIEIVRPDDPARPVVVHRGMHADDAERAIRSI